MLTKDSLDFFIQWHLTERCNLRCRHCYQESASSTELSLAEVRQGVDEIAEMIRAWSERYDLSFSSSINVTGGEPFIRSDLFEILEVMAAKGFELFLLSNGVLIDRERAGRLAGLSVQGVQVSLEGPEEIHESIRGKGSFAASLKGVGHLLAVGIPVTLNMTLTRMNAGTITEMVELSQSLGVDRLGFSRLVPSGKGKDLWPHLLSKDQVEGLYRNIFSKTFERLEIVTGDPLAKQIGDFDEGEDLGPIPLGGCAAGLSGLTILPDGTVTPCRRLPLFLGNIRKDSLRELWVSSPALERLRDRGQYQGKCASCKRWAACRGCRAIAYAYSAAMGKGNFLSEDPQCFLK